MAIMINWVFGWLVIFSITGGLLGCGKKGTTEKGGNLSGAPSEITLKKQGVTICEDALHDVIFIGPHTLPLGVAVPTGSLLGFAVGSANTILKTSDGGTTWRRVTTRDTKGPDFDQIVFTGISNGWASSTTVLLHTTDAGEHWSPAARLPGNFYYYGGGAGTATAYHQTQPATYGNRIYQTRDGGSHWQTLPAPVPRNDYGAMFFLDDLHGWMAGPRGSIARTIDGGATWQKADIPEGGDLAQIQFVSPSHGWVRSERNHLGGVWQTLDGGLTWKCAHAAVQPLWIVQDMQFLDDHTGYLLVNRGADPSIILKTTDGGSTWTEQGNYPNDICAISVPESGKAFAVGSGGKFYITHY